MYWGCFFIAAAILYYTGRRVGPNSYFWCVWKGPQVSSMWRLCHIYLDHTVILCGERSSAAGSSIFFPAPSRLKRHRPPPRVGDDDCNGGCNGGEGGWVRGGLCCRGDGGLYLGGGGVWRRKLEYRSSLLSSLLHSWSWLYLPQWLLIGNVTIRWDPFLAQVGEGDGVVESGAGAKSNSRWIMCTMNASQCVLSRA